MWAQNFAENLHFATAKGSRILQYDRTVLFCFIVVLWNTCDAGYCLACSVAINASLSLLPVWGTRVVPLVVTIITNPELFVDAKRQF